MAPVLTTASTIALISAFKEPILQSCKEIKSEISHFLDDGLPDYINSIKDKFILTKTFLYRDETVNFYDVFFPVSIQIKRNSKAVTSCSELFGESNFVSIIGSAGSGKTMLMKHFFLQSITTSYKIPLFIELRNLNDFSGSFTELINSVIFNNRLSPNEKILERLLDTGSFILLLDGYDEIYSDKKDAVTNDLDKFIDRYSKNHYIISSRPGSGVESIPRFNNYPVSPLNSQEIIHFIDLVLKFNEDAELAKKIKEVINRPENRDYGNFLSSPLLLSMFIMTFNHYPELPKKKNKFYWNVFDTLATKHDSFTKKGGYQHERKSGLQNEEFEKILQWFSYLALFRDNSKLNFDAQYIKTVLSQIKTKLSLTFNTDLVIEDLTVAISILILDGVEYKFPHKSLQEYFSASLIKDLPHEAKIKIYSEQYGKQLRHTFGGVENLWNLSAEIDNLYFRKYFILPSLKKFLETFQETSPVENLHQLFVISQFGVAFELKESNEFLPTFGSTMLSEYSSKETLLRFMGLEKPNMASMVTQVHKHSPGLIENYLKLEIEKSNRNPAERNPKDGHKSLYFRTFMVWNDEIKNALIDTGAVDSLTQVLNKIEKAVKKIEKDIQEEEKADTDLLGF